MWYCRVALIKAALLVSAVLSITAQVAPAEHFMVARFICALAAAGAIEDMLRRHQRIQAAALDLDAEAIVLHPGRVLQLCYLLLVWAGSQLLYQIGPDDLAPWLNAALSAASPVFVEVSVRLGRATTTRAALTSYAAAAAARSRLADSARSAGQ